MNDVPHKGVLAKNAGPHFFERFRRYGWIFLLLLVCEALIALFHFHKIVRHFVGDVLVVPLLWFLGKWSARVSSLKLLWGLLGLCMAIETLQLSGLCYPTNGPFKILKILLGTTFDGFDFLAYALGFLIMRIFISKKEHV
ncbi:MAG TPA: DUF2809 domain-containing protein [Flavobacteriaceae bacterium]|nr:DUF2809 domain-containing protein [Flavobacteriaceae bacterium]HPF11895.1 DUF2809 domain-containing protein [Flavobacteriaceae bacterium]HQU21172.1 DUF2809 domain-containing protein [Flavobacteriaceae bacterium]HQU65372.1 DUF2809 domain-containing protein [Flavobacteriaceae bacterium]HRW45435.1 DUF2809 domain-containing protein [Flavobacteriaceae bacterium]